MHIVEHTIQQSSLLSNSYGQLTPPTRTSCWAIQGHSPLTGYLLLYSVSSTVPVTQRSTRLIYNNNKPLVPKIWGRTRLVPIILINLWSPNIAFQIVFCLVGKLYNWWMRCVKIKVILLKTTTNGVRYAQVDNTANLTGFLQIQKEKQGLQVSKVVS